MRSLNFRPTNMLFLQVQSHNKCKTLPSSRSHPEQKLSFDSEMPTAKHANPISSGSSAETNKIAATFRPSVNTWHGSVYFALIYHGNELRNISVWDVKDLSADKAPGTAPLVSGHITQRARALPGSEASGPQGMAWVTSSHGPADKHVRGVHFQRAHHRTAPRVPSRPPPSRPLHGRGQKHLAISHMKSRAP